MAAELVPASERADYVPANPDTVLSDGTRERLERSVPENTKRAYARQWEQFTAWCSEAGRSPLPATPQTLAEYVSHLADLDRAPSTIEQAIASIRTAHRIAGHRGQPETDAALAALKVHRRDRAERASGSARPRRSPSPRCAP